MVDDYMLDNGIIQQKGHLGADIFANLITYLGKADDMIEKAYREINKHDELDHVNYESFDEDLQMFNKCRWEYDEFTQFADEYDSMVDSKFTANMEQVCNKLSDIRLEDIQIDNNLGIVDSEGSHYDTFGGTRLKHKINIRDVLNVECVDKAMKAEYEERRQMAESMLKMVEEDNWPEGISEDTKEIIRQYVNALNGGKLESYDDSINKLLTQGNFNFITKGEQNLSLTLDFIPLVGDAKGIAESIRGKEFITGRELSDEEKIVAGLSSLIGLIPGVGELGTIAKAGGKLGAKAAIKEGAKYTVRETLQAATMYEASSIATDLGITPAEQVMAIGGLSLARSGKAALKNPMVKLAVNNSADIAKATVKDAILADSGKVVLNAGIGGQVKQLYNSFKKVTAERKFLKEDIASGEVYIRKVPNNINSIKLKQINTGTAGSKSRQLVNGPYIKNGKPNGRPTLSGKKKLQFEKDVYNNNVDLDGVLRDPNTGEVISWKPSQPRKNVVDFGHKSGYSYKEMFNKYKNRDITLDELKDFQSNPDNYRLETPSSNRSHKFE